MCDKLVFDLAQEVEGSPSVFVRKDWINILDNMTQNYSGNQSIIDTSQLSNSNKYMSYREAYFLVPLTLSLASVKGGGTPANCIFDPIDKPCENAIGLKNWFGQIIHSFTLDYNGTTIIQQTPFINMWNSFKLMTSLSYGDIITQGATIGFYPDDPHSWTYTPASVLNDGTDKRIGFGQGVANSLDCAFSGNSQVMVSPAGSFCNTNTGTGNMGFAMRQSWVNYDATGSGVAGAYSQSYITRYGDLLTQAAASQLWKSVVYNKVAQANGIAGVLQTQVVATVYLKHIHSFFNMIPLLKGVFMKMTLLLNNCTTQFAAGVTVTNPYPFVAATQVTSAVGGCNPGLIAGTQGIIPNSTLTAAPSTLNMVSGSYHLTTLVDGSGLVAADRYQMYYYNISVGAVCLDQTMQQLGGLVPAPGPKSVYLYIPAYVFNPTFESAYLSSPVKQVKYTDVYQYPVVDQAPDQQINRLLTNGIADVKSVLVIPFYSRGASTTTAVTYANTALNGTATAATVTLSNNTGFLNGYPVFQSPFDPAGSGPTSPLCLMSNFNIQVSGQNAIYNTELYSFEQFNNQLYGQNSVNGGLTDGITSGLIDRSGFDMEYCYYYVNIERMLPVEKSVPKSIQFLGTNKSTRSLDFICFVEYGVEISIDALTGARV